MSVKKTETLFYGVYGLALWAIGAIVLRLAGDLVFQPGGGWRLALAFVLTVPLVVAFTTPVYERMGLPRAHWLGATVVILLSNVGPDALALAFFQGIFPNVDPEAARYVGAWLLWTYGVFLLTGFMASRPLARIRGTVRSA